MTEQFERLKSALAERYAIEREIGSGGMATVYLAEDRRHGRDVAVKVLRPELALAVGLLKEAIKMYGEIGMPTYVELAEELLAQT